MEKESNNNNEQHKLGRSQDPNLFGARTRITFSDTVKDPADINYLTAQSRLSDLARALENERRDRALKKMDERFSVRINRDIAKRGISYIDRKNRLFDVLNPFDLPAFSDTTLFEQIKYAGKVLSSSIDNLEKKEDIPLEGKLSASFLMSKYLYGTLQQRMNLPTGNLSSLNRQQQTKVSNYLQFFTERVMSMSSFPLEELQDVVGSLVDTGQIANEDIIRAFGDDVVANGSAIDQIINTVRDYEESARRRFVTLTLLTPLYRDVLVNRQNFSWPTISYVVNAIETYNHWLRLYNNKVLHTVLADEILGAWRQDATVGGFLPLRDACLQGEPVNAIFALNELSKYVIPHEGVPVYGFDLYTDKSDRHLNISTPFIRVKRTPSIDNIFGDTLVLQDEVTFPDSRISMDQRRLERLIALYAKLSSKKLENHVDLMFVSKYSEWSGLIQDSTGMTLDHLNIADLVDDELMSLVYFKSMIAIANGEMAGSSIVSVFAEPNQADLMKDVISGVDIYALLHKVMLMCVQDLLGVYRASLEWSDSIIWELLQKMELPVQAFVDDKIVTKYERTLSGGSPVLFSEKDSHEVVRYYIDHEAISVNPLLREMFKSIDNLGGLGSCTVSAEHRANFSGSMSPLVDASFYLLDPTVRMRSKRELVDSMTMLTVEEIYAKVYETRRDVDVNLFHQRTDDEGRVIDGFATVAQTSPHIDVVFQDQPRVCQLPIQYLKPEGAVITAEDIISLPNDVRAQIVPIDPRPFSHVDTVVFKLNAALPTLHTIRSERDITLNLRKWSHEILKSFDPNDGSLPSAFIISPDDGDDDQ